MTTSSRSLLLSSLVAAPANKQTSSRSASHGETNSPCALVSLPRSADSEYSTTEGIEVGELRGPSTNSAKS